MTFKPGRLALSTTARWAAAGLLALLAGCRSTPHAAPVEDRPSARAPAPHPVAPPASAPDAAHGAATPPPPPVTTPLADTRSPTYVVKPGDTLMRIGLDTGQSWRDIARWNNIDNPNVIEVGQVLKVLAPAGETVATTKPLTPTKLEGRPLDAKTGGLPASGASGAAAGVAAASPAPTPSGAAPVARDGDDELQWAWPAAGGVTAPFDETRSKGLAIGGKAGDAVFAAADGRVVYAGSGLRGYGNLVIVKHNATYLTAYAHNQVLLVKEDQIVKRGQKIAEMGATDTDKVQLHFEIRRQGKPIDPAKLLPAR